MFTSYAENMAAYIKSQHPEYSDKQIMTFVKEVIAARYKELVDNKQAAKEAGQPYDAEVDPTKRVLPTAQVLYYGTSADIKDHVYGCQYYEEEVPLLDLISSSRDKIISPFGSAYETADKCSGFLKGMIVRKTQERKSEKKLMLKAKKDNDEVAETYHNNNQATIKISMNSLIGGMGTPYCFLSNKANFNSVTSISRFFVMNSYAHVERFLCGNFFFKDEAYLINHLVTCRLYGPVPDDVLYQVKQYGWKIPTEEMLYEFLIGCLNRNNLPDAHPNISTFIKSMSEGERCFVYYMSNLKNMVRANETFWREWISDFFSTRNVEFKDYPPEKVSELDGDLVVVLSTVFHDLIPKNEAGNSISIYDCINTAPEIATKLYCIGVHMQSKVDMIQDIFDIFTNHKVGIPRIAEHKYMFRDAVMLSDTDSSIFVTKDWVRWYTGSYQFTPDAFNINALVVYLLSKANASMLANLSIAFGAVGKDIYGMNMKNEFMMPVLMLTSAKKCYISFLKIQEGVFYSHQRLDIKGVALRGSNFGRLTLNYVKWFVQSLLDDIYNFGQVSAKKYIAAVLKFERTIYDSLRRGETKFLTVTPIRNGDEYADSDRTIYFNYLFWEAVFAEKYGNIAIPTKCFVLPLSGVESDSYKMYLEGSYPDVAKKLAKFVKKNPKALTRIPINPATNVIPTELTPVADYRSTIYSNSRPLYLVLSSLGIVDGAPKNSDRLCSDIYGWIELTDQDRNEISDIIKEDEDV